MPKPCCGLCPWAETVPSDLQRVTCWGAPPVPVAHIERSPKGELMVGEALKRPILKRTDHPCAMFFFRPPPFPPLEVEPAQEPANGE
jgi:hypothetical protein